MIEDATSIISDVEVIWVNDSPNVPLEYDKELAKNIDLQKFYVHFVQLIKQKLVYRNELIPLRL